MPSPTVDVRDALNKLAVIAAVDPEPHLRQAMQPMFRTAQANTPVDTGQLLASATLDVRHTVGSIGYTPEGGRLGKRLGIEYGNRRTQAQMPLGRALLAHGRLVPVRFGVLFRRAVRKATRSRALFQRADVQLRRNVSLGRR